MPLRLGVQDQVPLLLGELVERRHPDQAGVVHEVVDVPERVHGSVARDLDLRRSRTSASNATPVPPPSAIAVHGLLGGLEADIDDRDGCSLRGEMERRFPSPPR
jgi:hypothetical protein